MPIGTANSRVPSNLDLHEDTLLSNEWFLVFDRRVWVRSTLLRGIHDKLGQVDV